MSIVCHLCGKGPLEINGWLERINEKGKGIEPIMECRPSCNTTITNEEAIVGAITGSIPINNNKIIKYINFMIFDSNMELKDLADILNIDLPTGIKLWQDNKVKIPSEIVILIDKMYKVMISLNNLLISDMRNFFYSNQAILDNKKPIDLIHNNEIDLLIEKLNEQVKSGIIK